MRRYRFEETCPGCPHQFDVWDGDTKVAYVRYRWNYLRVNPYKPEKIMVKCEYTGKETEEQKIDDSIVIFGRYINEGPGGILPYDKVDKILDKLDKEIQKYYNTLSEEKEEKEWYND